MNMCYKSIVFPFLLLFLLATTSTPSQAQTIESLLDRLEAKWESVERLEASFTQTLKTIFDDRGVTTEGTLLLEGEKYRFDTGNMLLVADGERSWALSHDEKQMMVADLEEDEEALSPSDLLSNFDETLEPSLTATESIDGDRHFVITLTPKSPDAQFMTATVWMRDKDDMVTQIEYTDHNESVTFMKLKEIRINGPIASDAFQLSAPEGYAVIDLNEQ